jgi:hypothetical protein
MDAAIRRSVNPILSEREDSLPWLIVDSLPIALASPESAHDSTIAARRQCRCAL